MFPLCGLRAAAGSIKLHKRETMKKELPDLTKRHFEFISGVIANVSDPLRRAEMAIHFAEECRKTNTQFKYDMFLRACGLEVRSGKDAKTI
jgi:hypothetical protein